MVEVRIEENDTGKIRNTVKFMREMRKLPAFKQKYVQGRSGGINVSWREFLEADFSICLTEYDMDRDSRIFITANRRLWVMPVVLRGTVHVTFPGRKAMDIFGSQYHLLLLEKAERIELVNLVSSGLICLLLFDPKFFQTIENVYMTASEFSNGKYSLQGRAFHFLTLPMQQVMKYILSEIVDNTRLDVFRMTLCVRTFVVMAMAELDKLKKSTSSIAVFPEWQVNSVREAAIFLAENLDEYPGTAKLARKSAMNVSTFRKVFAETMGCGAQAYWNDKRMETARQWLIQHKFKPLEVARTLGFSSSQSFNKQFKKHFGIAPSQMYKNHQ
ncbi:helix-turn-helix transcriptional regulator [Rhizosphaericola mali]|uniref:Helix-turn-helix transcriptional regulator n=1 Tax=Rhizosphaericola mali TaxID=2545455 RepID=A0A5P2FZX5_9BACT|nr:AraC family transcriptional regulator [Rhizosphaericola mali]QES88527.1 helix-turn-helix transcriptional regulator [Rhizosphaericola mali]